MLDSSSGGLKNLNTHIYAFLIKPKLHLLMMLKAKIIMFLLFVLLCHPSISHSMVVYFDSKRDHDAFGDDNSADVTFNQYYVYQTCNQYLQSIQIHQEMISCDCYDS